MMSPLALVSSFLVASIATTSLAEPFTPTPANRAMCSVLVGAGPHRGQALQPCSGHEAIVRVAAGHFEAAGLELPIVEIVPGDSDRDCAGHLGLFEPSQEPWRITICSDLPFVPVHELAHAWINSHVDEATRTRYFELRDRAAWSSPDLDWNERGVEDAAFVIQQNLMAYSTGELSEEWESRAIAYELLTGMKSPLRTTTDE